MLRLVTITLLAVVASGLSACAEEKNQIPPELLAMMKQADSFELLSLEPKRPQAKPKNAFHGWKVLGQTEVKNTKTRSQIVSALQKGVKENDGVVAACFNPRHGIRVKVKEQTAEFVICFECYSAKAYKNGKLQGSFLTTESPQPTFNKVLEAAQVPLPKGSEP